MKDIIDHLKQLKWKKIDFLTMPLNEQLNIKGSRSQPDLDLQQKDGDAIRRFNSKWYETFPWLTGSSRFNKIYCFVCVIYGGETSWSDDGINVIKNFVNKAEKHQCSRRHIKNMESFMMMGKSPIIREKEKVTALITKKQKEEDMRRRQELSHIIDAILFLIRRQKNFGNFQTNILLFLEQLSIRKYVSDESLFNPATGEQLIQLITCMETVVLEDIKKEIRESDFCSLQIDELPNAVGKYSVIVRYAHKGQIKERFIGFFEIHQMFDLAKIINSTIGDARKLVCHSYDGCVLPMKSVRQGIKSLIPKVLFLHNYMHKLNMILLQGLQNISECRTFNKKVESICDFFRNRRRYDVLKREGVILPPRRETLWIFNSSAVLIIKKHHGTILKVVNSFIENKCCLDLEVQYAASSVRRFLKDVQFVLLSCLINRIFFYTDHLSKIIQRKINQYVDNCIEEIEQTIKNISYFKTDIVIKHCVDEAKIQLNVEITSVTVEEFKKTAFLIIDNVIEQIKERFHDTKFLKLFEILDCTKFINYQSKFPKSLVQELVKNCPNLFQSHILENELATIYGDSSKRFNPYQLFSYLYDNGLTKLYEETYKLLQLYLTYPLMPTDPDESCCALGKVRNYLNCTEGGKASKSDILFVENYCNNSNENSLFKNKVIEQFLTLNANDS